MHKRSGNSRIVELVPLHLRDFVHFPPDTIDPVLGGLGGEVPFFAFHLC